MFLWLVDFPVNSKSRFAPVTLSTRTFCLGVGDLCGEPGCWSVGSYLAGGSRSLGVQEGL